jgi:hypothetical protein
MVSKVGTQKIETRRCMSPIEAEPSCVIGRRAFLHGQCWNCLYTGDMTT